jgi:hypothetical protein
VFNDDRMFVLYLCRAEVNEVGTPAYEANRIDVFPSESVAIDWLKDAEPRTPLISLGGERPGIQRL